MEIISYLKGKKVQDKVKELHEVVGQDNFKNGVRDVTDVWVDAHTRVSKLEQKHENDSLNNRIESLTELVAINLNKQHLFVGMHANNQKTKHEQLVFQDFDSTSDYVVSKSSNVSLTASGIKPVSALVDGAVVLHPEPTDRLMRFIALTSHSDVDAMEITFELADISQFHQAEISGTDLILSIKDAEYNVYHQSGYVKLKPFELDEELTIQNALYNKVLQGSAVKFFYALSEDGIDYSEYKALESGSVLRKWVSIKVEIHNTLTSGISKSVSSDSVSINAYSQISSNAVSLKDSYSLDMTKDEKWTDEGSLHRKRISRDEWISIDKINV